jgi:uncharacterized membrane protein
MKRRTFAELCAADFLSPKDFVRHAVLFSLVFLAAHLAGLREFTSVISGTAGSVAMSWQWSVFLGACYLFAYLAFVLLVPMFLLAAALLAVWERVRRHRETTKLRQSSASGALSGEALSKG